MPTYEEGNNAEHQEWKPARKPLAPKMVWTAADERKFQAKKARQEELETIGQVAQTAHPDKTQAEALVAWAFKK